MDITIMPESLSGRVRAIPSKSFAHRLLICSALSDRKTFVKCTGTSEDIDATVRSLIALGAGIDRSEEGFEVTPIPEQGALKRRLLDCGESGSTLRFMLPVACALGTDSSFKLAGRLPSRPMSHLEDELKKHGCNLSGQGGDKLCASGQLRPGHYILPGDVSSQYVSGLLFALPLLQGDSQIEITGNIESKDYIYMTLAALEEFGIQIEFCGNRLNIKGGTGYKSPGKAEVEGDWSNAAFWLCAGALGGSGIECRGLNTASIQGDREVLDIVAKFGAEVKCRGDSVTVKPSVLKGLEIDARDIPDLVPALSAVAAIAGGTTVIKNASRLRIKESDRLQTVAGTLSALGADITETEDGLLIKGRPRLTGGVVDSCGDHRIAMMAAIAAAACVKPVTIKNAEAVNKSYPNFFRDFRSLGGRANEG
ncbi:MAG: 3-phosphoshikimate 1-carboxyvinyltransferase [Clostridiales bacterium]|jgi:3-phosphoshikimate 1-carboxyvinyltransferase|nr:3-phosphoshikimate 1-carboxyvinyltransferase [Clostridiales bacterium]